MNPFLEKNTLKCMNIHSFIRQVWKGISNPWFVRERLELRRLRKYPRYRPATVCLRGRKIDIVDAETYISGYNEIFRSQLYRFRSNTHEPYIVDCGSNIGLSVIYFKLVYPNAEVVAFEPDPNIFEVLKHNIGVFGFNNVRLVNAAVSKSEGAVDFVSEGAHSGRIPKPGDQSNDQIKVRSVRLEKYLYRNVDLLKIDIEGAESSVIDDIEDMLGTVKHLFVEYHSHRDEIQELDRMLRIFTTNGFRYQILNSFSSKQPFWRIETLAGMDLQLNIFAYKDE